jgi:hypothetical protein
MDAASTADYSLGYAISTNNSSTNRGTRPLFGAGASFVDDRARHELELVVRVGTAEDQLDAAVEALFKSGEELETDGN